MGYIKEPKGIDFVIVSDPLTDEARQEISEFIRTYKSKLSSNKKSKPAIHLKQSKAVQS
jgi:hypothetical protein